jgi:DNA-binding CsgD family transcriptional regulator
MLSYDQALALRCRDACQFLRFGESFRATFALSHEIVSGATRQGKLKGSKRRSISFVRKVEAWHRTPSLVAPWARKRPLLTAFPLTPAHSASQSNRVGEGVKATNETQVLLCQPLNATEIEVSQHLADGLGTAEIAASRSTTAQVIKNYTYRACQKLGADNRAHLIAVAFRAGLSNEPWCRRLAT